MQFMGCEVATYCIGQAASGAAVILMAGTKGKRFILPNAKVMLHQPYGGITGQAEDIRIQAEEVLRDKIRLNNIIAKCTGKSLERVTEDTERDRFPQRGGSVGVRARGRGSLRGYEEEG